MDFLNYFANLYKEHSKIQALKADNVFKLVDKELTAGDCNIFL